MEQVIFMNQTPPHDHHNPDLLNVIPDDARKIIEIGASSGALAREWKKCNVGHYVCLDIDPACVELSKRYSDYSLLLNIEEARNHFWTEFADRDCWIFGDSLEHMVNPWAVLSRVHKNLPHKGCVVACIPNAQHWSMYVRLAYGDLKYQESGLMDRTHLRWFSRKTIVQMFEDAGFSIEKMVPRIFSAPTNINVLPAIKQLAELVGTDARACINDSLPLQYVIRARKTVY